MLKFEMFVSMFLTLFYRLTSNCDVSGASIEYNSTPSQEKDRKKGY